jgi:hypothetical protein
MESSSLFATYFTGFLLEEELSPFLNWVLNCWSFDMHKAIIDCQRTGKRIFHWTIYNREWKEYDEFSIWLIDGTFAWKFDCLCKWPNWIQ